MHKIIYEIYIKASNSESLIAKIKNALYYPNVYKLYAITDNKRLAKTYVNCNKDFSLFIVTRTIYKDFYNKLMNKYSKYVLHKFSNNNGDTLIIREMDIEKYRKLIRSPNNNYKKESELTKEDYALIDLDRKNTGIEYYSDEYYYNNILSYNYDI